jgi:hypothetical protein
MGKRSLWTLLGLLLAATLALAPFSASAAKREGKFLKGVPVTGTLADGGTFTGKVTITSFDYDAINGLTVSGIVKGSATTADGVTQDVSQSFSDVPATLNETAGGGLSPVLQASCQILFLDIGPIFLDLLGLQLDLSEIVLDLTAVSGAGNLLGNLLCAVAGLLDPGGFLTGLLSELTALLEAINDILG